MDRKPNPGLEKSENDSFTAAALWAGGALAIVAGIVVYAGMQG